MKKSYDVLIPIAGHVFLTVEAESEEEAIELGMERASLEDIEEWTTLERFSEGNVCYCPSPWEAEAEVTEI